MNRGNAAHSLYAQLDLGTSALRQWQYRRLTRKLNQ